MGISENTGVVVDIERFSTQNGPGIRTTAFLKGCPLRCAWCGNPETQTYVPEIMLTEEKCDGCGKCLPVCPHRAISPAGRRVSIRFDLCMNCLQCAQTCPEGAIRVVGKRYSPQDLYEAVIRDREFYGSRGGVTFTGGEPLSQWEFLLPVLKKLKEDGIGVCMDTTGFVEWTVLESVKDYVTIFLYDVKHLDTKRHQAGTGVKNEGILENLKKLAASGSRIWLRVPLIPDFNDDDAHVRSLADLARDLDVERLCFLPFHTLGREKYRQLGREYPMGAAEAYPSAKMLRVRNLAERSFPHVYVS